jgi:hypothetical protein
VRGFPYSGTKPECSLRRILTFPKKQQVTSVNGAKKRELTDLVDAGQNASLPRLLINQPGVAHRRYL